MIRPKFIDNILEVIRTIGPMAIQEIIYLFLNDNFWILALNSNDISSSNRFQKKIQASINELVRQRKICEYLCDTGYRRRYGVPELDISLEIPLKLELNICLEKCRDCISWVINYSNKKKHLSFYSCNLRQKKILHIYYSLKIGIRN